MNPLTLELLDGSSVQRIDGVVSMVAEDASGQFGLLPGHEALITVVLPGLVRFRCDDASWQYLACAGGVLVCRDGIVRIVSSRFLAAPQEEALAGKLDQTRALEHHELAVDRASQLELERTMMRRLREISELARP